MNSHLLLMILLPTDLETIVRKEMIRCEFLSASWYKDNLVIVSQFALVISSGCYLPIIHI